MTALMDSKLLYVATGALILASLFVPLALCVLMPVTVCAAIWAVILDHAPVAAVLALVAVALNAWLMLGYIGAYKGMLRRRALTTGEDGRRAPISTLSTRSRSAAILSRSTAWRWSRCSPPRRSIMSRSSATLAATRC